MQLRSCVLPLSLCWLVTCIPVSGTVDTTSGLQYFFNFGDSYTQNGFVNQYSNTKRNDSNPTGLKLGSDTFALGLNYVEYLTVIYNNTKVYDYDFGLSGSTIDQSIVSPERSNGKNTFKDQVERLFLPIYNHQAGGKVRWTGDNSVFSIFFGINDIVGGCSDSSQIDELITSYLKLADKLAGVGARRFLLINVPPVDRSPARCLECNITTCAKSISSFNAKLTSRAKSWAKSKKVSLTIYDLHSFMTMVLDSPRHYGFDNATCADAKGYCVWQNQNPFHTGFAFNKIQAQDMLPQMEAILNW